MRNAAPHGEPQATGLEGRVALVTGGSKGIGRAVARPSRAKACISRSARAASRARRRGGEPRASACQARHPDRHDRRRSRAAFVAAAADHFGRIDILINNAVTSTQNSFAALSDDEFRYHIDVKLMGYIRCARAVWPHMRRRGWGRIVNVAGMTARIVTDFRMTNGVVNSAVTNFTKHLAEQTGKDGITVNAVHPGYTWTPRLEGILRQMGRAGEHLLRRGVQAPPRGDSDRAIHRARGSRATDRSTCARMRPARITGQAIAVDGGSGRSINY